MENEINYAKSSRYFNITVNTAAALACLFAFYAWVYSAGFPYIYDGNETALSFVHALNLFYFNPFKFGFLTGWDTIFSAGKVIPDQVYTHNPNFPRYLHYVLLLLGIKSFTAQVLIIILPATLLNVLSLKWLLAAYLGDKKDYRWIWVVSIFAMIFDYIGFLAYTVNTYRTFSFCLLWLAMLAVIRPWPRWGIFAVFFLVFQFEYGFAIFVLGASLTFLLVNWPAHLWRTSAAAIAGSLVSMLVFLIQLRIYMPFKAILNEFLSTSARRGSGHVSSYFSETLPRLSESLQRMNAPIQNAFLIWALLSSIVLILYLTYRAVPRSEILEFRLRMARLYVALIGGAIGLSLTMTNYFLEAYFGSMLPFLTFFNAIATGVVVADGVILLSWSAPSVFNRRIFQYLLIGTLAVVSVLPMLSTSWTKYQKHPGLSGGYVHVLKKHFLNKPILVEGHFNQDPSAITGGATLQMTSTEFDVVTSDFSRFDKYRNESGQLVYLCLDIWGGCDLLVKRLRERNGQVLFRGADFAFVGIDLLPKGGTNLK